MINCIYILSIQILLRNFPYFTNFYFKCIIEIIIKFNLIILGGGVMYYSIEKEFKKKSWYKRDLIFILLLSISYMILAVALSVLFGSVLFSYGLTLLIVPTQYTYIFFIVKKYSKFSVKYWNLKSNVEKYIDEKESRDVVLLAHICKKNSINTRAKVSEAIRHYQILLPRNIIGSGIFLSLVAKYWQSSYLEFFHSLVLRSLLRLYGHQTSL